MGRDNSNVGQRMLQARSYLRGSDDSLANIIGVGLPDGAVCYVLEKQASYRFVKSSTLAPDEFGIVVEPVGSVGRWVRESGTVGFALLSGGAPDAPNAELSTIVNYGTAQMVQFALEKETGILVYTGDVPRLASVFVYASSEPLPVVSVNHGNHDQWTVTCGVTELKTGSRLRLTAEHRPRELVAGMQVILL